ncbi:hypothetical protein G0Q06_04020 [Puniceicoccales bacterium CK1056]|uniref:GEVED domain-containing protein n=1 Tax=Oceanipulchritudo coccoides TaxID=2706888 RepID=A0A6B2LZX6_9BACT|nr:GEVED domain-containing protein [Oceanipulchritudo coccoides]NDV61609.1 hypothetical protein [Oceanipulchritudo coccoides]
MKPRTKRSLVPLMAAACLFTIVVMVPRAEAIIAGSNWDIHMDIEGVVANDYHIEGVIYSGIPGENWSYPPTLVDHIDGNFPNFSYSMVPDLSDPDQFAYIFQADWTGADYEFCQDLHLGLFFDLECHNLMIDLKGWWTKDGEPVGMTLLPGFEAEDEFGPTTPHLRLRNDSQIPGEIVALRLTGLSPEEVEGLFGTAQDMFPELAPGGLLDPENPQSPVPWSEGKEMDPTGQLIPMGPKDFPAESFFDVFYEIEIDTEPGDIVADPPLAMEAGNILVAAELVRYINESGVEEFNWTWELHESHGIDFGDAPDQSYQTLLASDGARHIAQGVYLGQVRDTELDGQPTALADGDDNNPAGGPDDEDGVTFTGSFVPGSAVGLNVQVNGTGFLNIWADWNRDGMWDPSEQVLTPDIPVSTGTFVGAIVVPPAPPTGFGPTYMRFRVSSQPGLQWFGLAVDGEVEDYRIDILDSNDDVYDWGDAPDAAAGPAYPTWASSNGARHLLSSQLWLGGGVDPEPDGQPTIPADGDDISGFPDDEDGVALPISLMQGITATVNVFASGSGLLNAWVDFDQNSSWLDAFEHVIVDAPVVGGPNSLSFLVPAVALPGNTYMRFRLSTQAGLTPSGPAPDGEVEDYLVLIEESAAQGFDWGDAPDFPQVPGYPTLSIHNGAHHFLGGVYLGNVVDPEPDGQPTIPADGDDLAALPDEDGVTFLMHLVKGKTSQIQVWASAVGFLNAWMDYNQNTSWADPGEHVFIDTPLVAGPNNLTLTLPASAVFGNTYFRFRFSSAPGLSFDGFASDGEVEDYRVEVCELADTVITTTASNDVVLNWTPVTGATSYAIYSANHLGSFYLWNYMGPAAGPPWTHTAPGWMPLSFYYVVAEP